MLKRSVPVLLAALAGLLPILSSLFTTPKGGLQAVTNELEQGMLIVTGFAALLGVVNVLQTNVKKIERRASGWPYALVLLVCLIGTAVVGLNQAIGENMDWWGWWTVWDVDAETTAFEWVQLAFFQPLQATMFSLLAFYIASAAFRAFRVRNVEAAILLVAALIVMLGVNPYGVRLFSWVPAMGPVPGGSEFMPWLTNWVMNVPNAAAQRGIIIGAALGAAAMSLRVLLGIERSYLGIGRGES